MTDLEQRVQRLKQRNRRLRRIGLLVRLLAASVCLCFPVSVLGETKKDGNFVLKLCGSLVRSAGAAEDPTALEAMHIGWCAGYMYGTGEQLMMQRVLNEMGQGSPPIACLPDAWNPGQLARVVEKYLREHPEVLHEHSYGVTSKALREAFPCGPGKEKECLSLKGQQTAALNGRDWVGLERIGSEYIERCSDEALRARGHRSTPR